MAIDLAPYEAPIKEAADKLEGDTGAADKAQADLTSLSRTLADYGTRHQAEATSLQGNWVGARGDLFGVKAKEHTQALDDAATWASKTAQTIGDATSLVKDAQQQCQSLLTEFDADARTLVNAAASSTDPGAEMQARAVLAGMSAKYAKEAADIVNAAKGRLQDLVNGLNATVPASAPPRGRSARAPAEPAVAAEAVAGTAAAVVARRPPGPRSRSRRRTSTAADHRSSCPAARRCRRRTSGRRSPCARRCRGSACRTCGAARTRTRAWTAAG